MTWVVQRPSHKEMPYLIEVGGSEWPYKLYKNDALARASTRGKWKKLDRPEAHIVLGKMMRTWERLSPRDREYSPNLRFMINSINNALAKDAKNYDTQTV